MERKLSDNHLKLYAPPKKLGKLFEVIQNDPELSFEIRREDTSMVYYRKKKLLEIKKGRIKELISNSYLGKESIKYDLRHEENLNKKEAIIGYFKQAKRCAYSYSFGAEMELQQHIMLGNSSFENRYLVVDMEWSFSQSDTPEEKRLSKKTRIDLVIIDLHKNENGENDTYLTEVKLGINAIKGESGIKGHVEKTKSLINNPIAHEALKKDIENIINQKHQLGIITGTRPKIIYADKPKLMLILAYRTETEKHKFEKELKNIQYNKENTRIILYNMFNRLEDK